MKAEELHKFLAQWRKLKKYPSSSSWPDAVTLSTDIWKKLEEIKKYTSKDGHEYALNLFFIDGDIIATPFTRGEEGNVTTKDSIQVKFESKGGENYYKKIFVNSRLVKTSHLKRSEVKDKIELSHLFNVHTHPAQQERFSFFSSVDIRSFLSLNTMVMGLITDRLWLICKTSSSLSNLGENGATQINYISHQIFSGNADINKLIKENLSNWGVVFYEGKIRESLVKI